ncbi:hypothetical protein FJY63_13270, partial [Candidatus Sumerlaeota bacterium]|nr:hypothetical protein [Candidatus Sumerlaeota bacterium]
MLDIADYRVDGLKLRVRLKCSCGGRSIVKMMVGAEPFYRCAKCNAQSSLNQLRNIATMCWRGQIWEVECEELKKEMAPAVTSYPATLTVGPSRQSQPFCVLDGHCIVLSPTGMQFLARNFKKEYFRPIDNEMRYAAVQWTRPVQGLPSKLTGSIVEVKFREEELPICQIRVVFHE